ncbi:histidine kinase dimerization/phospho-acceptor domain-containing protein [Verrucomicrobium spinosum]|uniref:histidine kinase dimerization/phospho-acceptor domain-containing protein n=1 Tax=Verrucomicrobium spinosum TaxID=2736 RepID=UPI00094635DB|nr:histidine kinase dimerization/phospho-acceptor domain-containing protein [Verrucomicrobium spinosum]
MLFRESLKQLRREERLAAAKVRAEQSEKEKSIFLATMSHEIRTPMNAILGFSELLANEAQSEQEKRHAETILVSGRALLQIINDILDLSKIEAGMLQISSDPVMCGTWCASCSRCLPGRPLSEAWNCTQKSPQVCPTPC